MIAVHAESWIPRVTEAPEELELCDSYILQRAEKAPCETLGNPRGQTACVLIPVILLSSWVILGKLLNLSEPQLLL